MDQVLVITDDPGRGTLLAHELADAWTCRVHDLHDDRASAIGDPTVVVSDVADLSAHAVPRLRRLVTPLRGTPLLVLLHQQGAQARVQAIALGAVAMIAAASGPDAIRTTLGKLEARGTGSAIHARKLADTARRYFSEIFVPNVPVTPTVIDSGTHLIARAVRETGVRDWVRAVRRFDDATHQHCLLVAGLAAGFATHLGLAEPDRYRLTKGALLHDVGKVHIPPAILNKPGKLTDEEMAVVRTHPARGHAMLVGQGFEDEMLAVARSHHEMLDGSGYPDGLAGDAIPDLVRLVTICDIYAALIERRPYKPPMARETAYGILESMAGRLDPVLVEAFRPIATLEARIDTVMAVPPAPDRPA